MVTLPPETVDVVPGPVTWYCFPWLLTIWCRSLIASESAVNFRTDFCCPLTMVMRLTPS